jgi:hypothetical protein
MLSFWNYKSSSCGSVKVSIMLKNLCGLPIIPAFLCLICLPACSSEESAELPEHAASLENVTVLDPDAEPAYSLDFEEIYSVGNREPVLFSRVNYIAVDEDGNLYAAESFRGQETIYVFDSNGDLVTTIGRNGAGPGEFRSIYSLSYHSGMLYVLDYSLQRFQGFSTDSFDALQITELNPSDWDISSETTAVLPNRIEAISDDKFLGIFYHLTLKTDQYLIYHINNQGRVISDQLISIDYIRHLRDTSTGSAFYDPFGGRGLISVSDNNRIFTTWSEDFLIRVLDESGNDLHAFYYPIDRAELNNSEALEFFGTGERNQSYQRALRNDGIPDRWRAIEHMVVDDENRIWVSVITGDSETYDWWLMDDRGQLLAKFTWPRSRVVKEVKNGILYAVETDGETGVQKVAAFNIDLQTI